METIHIFSKHKFMNNPTVMGNKNEGESNYTKKIYEASEILNIKKVY